MAVYQGARPRSGVLPRPRLGLPGPGPAAEAPALPRRRARAAVRARRRSNRVGLIIGSIAVAFLLAFFSLAQTVRQTTTGYDLDNLQVQQTQLQTQIQQLQSDLDRLGQEPAIRKQAIDAGLAQLSKPLVIQAR